MKTKLVLLLISAVLLVGARMPPAFRVPPVSTPPPSEEVSKILDYLARAALNNELRAAQFPAEFFPAPHEWYLGRAAACRDAIDAVHILTATPASPAITP